MTEVRISTPRGVRLAGTFVVPVDSTDAAVIFAHSFLADRHSGEHFDRLAAAYRGAGYATLEFDFSGCGDSDDDVITLSNQVEDLHSASAWLKSQGFDRQVLHAHSFGTLAALTARPEAAQTMVLTGMITGPLSFDWSQIFSESQLDDLERHGHAMIPDDNKSNRKYFVISKQTLIDLSMNETEALVGNLKTPILAIHDFDDEQMGLVEMTQEVFSQLPKGSRVEVVRDARFGVHEGVDVLRELSVQWATRLVPVRP
ncbi:MAG: alpha/beta fold hydrolase [Actinomycetaceae bacterium]|nr:alpha/beta fold hydrolase [Actinomycetaceae bacterium]